MELVDQKEFLNRRKKVQKRLKHNEVLLCFSGSLKTKSRDVDYPFKQNTNFLYLTGLTLSEGVLVMTKKEEILFLKEKTPLARKWTGPSITVKEVKKRNWVSQCKSLDDFNTQFLQGYDELIVSWFEEPQKAEALWREVKASGARARLPKVLKDLDVFMTPLRAVKSSWEIDKIKKSCAMAVQAHAKLRSYCQVGHNEKELETYIHSQFLNHGAEDIAYGIIMAGGNRANYLHYEDNNQTLKKGDLLLVDAGCNYQGYASDITRTYPVSGQWTKYQMMIAKLVAKAHQQCIKMLKPGVSWYELNEKAKKVLGAGLKDLGILKGTVGQIIKSSEFRDIYPHGLGHGLGLDVHDLMEYPREKKDLAKLVKGNVITIEPGLYFDKANKNIPKEFRGMGVRLEDNLLITQNGSKNLTEKLLLL